MITVTNLHGDAGREVSAEVLLDEERQRIYFRDISRQPVDLRWSGEALVAIGILPAMHTGDALRVSGSIEHGFLRNMSKVQDLYKCWFPDWSLIEISGSEIDGSEIDSSEIDSSDIHESSAQHPGRTALFFTGGLDSFFSFLTNRDDVTDWIYVHGYDVPLADTELRDSVSAYLRSAADSYGVNLIEIETNLRMLLDAHTPWLEGYGAALAAVGLLLGEHIGTILKAGSYDYRLLRSNGTHPLLDPLWSTSYTTFVHSGGESSRVLKTVAVAQDDTALGLLRVCWQDPTPGALNCCRCEKCVRTMVSLKTIGKLEQAGAFPRALRVRDVLRVKTTPITRSFWIEIADLQAEYGANRFWRMLVSKPVANGWAHWLYSGALQQLQIAYQRARTWNRERLRRRRLRKHETD